MADNSGPDSPTPRPADAPLHAAEQGAPSEMRAQTDGQGPRPALLKTPAFFVVLAVLLVGKAWMMRDFAIGSKSPVGIVLEAGVVLVILGIVDLIPPRRMRWLDLVAYSLVSTLLFALTVYVHFYQQLFDPSMMAMAGQLGTVSDAVGHLIKPVYILFFLDIPFLAAWIVLSDRQAKARVELSSRRTERTQRELPAEKPLKRSWRVAAVTLVAAIVVAAQVVSALKVPDYVDGVALAKARGLTIAQAIELFPREDSSVDDTSTDVAAPVTSASSAPTASVPTTAAQLTPAGQFEARVEHIRGSLEGSRITTFSAGAYKGKNLIIIQVEALNEWIEGRTVDGHVITPNLNKLVGESWYFPNTYSETGIGNTADAEFTVNSSLYSPRDQAAAVAYADRKIPALPRLLNDMNYSTFTMHVNGVMYWNRKMLYGALGFSKFYDREFFRNPDRSIPDKIGMGASDEVLYKKALTVLESKEASHTPFYCQLITLSSHTPFDAIPQSRRPVRTPSEYAGSLLGNYVSAQSYMDFALGKFIAKLKKDGVWNNSVVMIYGDHTSAMDAAPSGMDAAVTKAVLGRPYGPSDRQRVSLIVHLPGQKEGVTSQNVCGEIDVMPTAADLLGIDISQVPHFGKSVFVGSNALVPLNSYYPSGSYVNDRVVFEPGMGFDDGSAFNVADSTSAKKTDREKTDYERTVQLEKLCAKWVTSLPKRSDAGSLGDAWIPDPTARKAGASLGAKQKGTGSVP